MAGNMMTCRQAWWERKSCEFYSLIHWQQKETVSHSECSLSMRPQSPPPQWHISSNKTILLIVPLTMGQSIQTHKSMGGIPIQITTVCSWLLYQNTTLHKYVNLRLCLQLDWSTCQFFMAMQCSLYCYCSVVQLKIREGDMSRNTFIIQIVLVLLLFFFFFFGFFFFWCIL